MEPYPLFKGREDNMAASVYFLKYAKTRKFYGENRWSCCLNL